MTSACSSGRLCLLLVLIVLIGFSACHAADAKSTNETEDSKEERTPDQWKLFYQVVNKLQDMFPELSQLDMVNLPFGDNRIEGITELLNRHVLNSGTAEHTSEKVRDMMEKFTSLMDDVTQLMKDGKEVTAESFREKWDTVVNGWDSLSPCQRRTIIIVLGTLGGATIARPAVSFFLTSLGFGPHGIVANSIAARIQSFYYRGFTTGYFSLLQSYGMTGIQAPGAMMMGAAGGAIAGLGAWVGL
jgi:hypothetical protein